MTISKQSLGRVGKPVNSQCAQSATPAFLSKRVAGDSRMEHKEVETSILSFLKARGYIASLNALKTEAKISVLPEPSAKVEHIFAATANASDPENYCRNYESLKRWIIHTLEQYRQDLERVLFPAFAFLYLEMIKHALPEEARDFFRRFHTDHPYCPEIAQLESLNSLQKLDTDIGRRFLESRVKVQISKYALELLMSFIESESYSLVFWVLNKYVDFEVTPDAVEAKAVLLDEDSKFVRNTEQMTLTAYGEELKGKRDARNYVPHPPHFVERRREEDRMRRVRVSEDQLPSVCMHTVLQAAWTCLCADISEDASMVLCGFEDSVIRLWDFKAKDVKRKRDFYEDPEDSEYRVFPGHSGGVFAVQFSPCHRVFISASEDGTVRLWSLISMSNVSVLKGHLFPVWTLAFSLQGFHFASGGADYTARLWATDSCTNLRIFTGHLGEVTAVKFHPNGLYLGSCSSDKTVRVWDLASAACLRLLAGHCVAATAIDFLATGKTLVSADENGVVIAWNLLDGSTLWENQVTGAITSVCGSREDTLIGLMSESNRVYVVSSPTGSVVLDCPTKDTAVLAGLFTWRDLMVTVGVYREL